MARANILLAFKQDTRGLKATEAATKRTTTAVRVLSAAAKSLGLVFGAAGLLQILRSSIKASIEQSQALAQVEAGIKSTGAAAGLTTQQIAGMAAEQQKLNNVGDETILKMNAVLLTFTKIHGEMFPRTSQAVIDLATKMGTDLTSSALQVGKALNDPIRGLDGLSRAGIQFTDQQKAVIKAMAEGGDVAGAQALVLDELEKQFGGAGEAAAQAAGGGMKSFSLVLGDIQENILPFTKQLDSIARALAKISGSKGASSIFETIAEAATKFTSLGLLTKVLDEIERQGREPKQIMVDLARVFTDDLPTGLEATINKAEKLHFDQLADDAEDFAKAAREAADNVLRLHDNFLKMQQLGAERTFKEITASLREIATGVSGDIALIDGTQIAADYAEALADGQSLYVNGSRAMTEWESFFAQVGEFLKRSLQNAVLQALDVLTSISVTDSAAMKDAFSGIGKQLGGDFGAVVGSQFGPWGEIFGRVAGEKIGAVFGKAAGGFAAMLARVISGASGRDLIGSFAAGPGGFFGSGGNDPRAAAFIEQMKQIFAALDAALGSSLELSQNMLVEIRKNGEAVLKIIETSTGRVLSTEVFTSAEQAMQEGMIKLLGGAIVAAEGPFAAAFQSLLRKVLGSGAELDIEGLVAAFQALSKIAVTMTGLGNEVDRLRASMTAQQEIYLDTEAAILALNLPMEIELGLLEDLAGKHARFNNELKTSVLVQMAAWARELGLGLQLQRKAAILENRVRFLKLKVELKMLGLWEKWGGLARELFQAGKAAAKAIGDLTDSVGGLAFGATSAAAAVSSVGTGTAGTAGGATNNWALFRAWAISKGYTNLMQMGQAELEAIWAQWVAETGGPPGGTGGSGGGGGGGGPAPINPLDAIQDIIRGILDSLRDFRATFDIQDFSAGTPFEKAGIALQNVKDLFAAAMTGDLDALKAFQQAAQDALKLGGIFGNASGTFQSDFVDLIKGMLDSLLGAGLDVTTPGASPAVSAIVEQTSALAGLLERGNTARTMQTDTLAAKLDTLIANTAAGPGFVPQT